MTRPRPLLLRGYLRELSDPICCRGNIFGFVAVAPLSPARPASWCSAPPPRRGHCRCFPVGHELPCCCTNQRPFVLLHFGSASTRRQVPHRTPSTSTNDTGCKRACTTFIPCMSPSTTTLTALQVQLRLPRTTTVDPRRLRGRQVPRRDPEPLRNVYDYETCTTTSTTTRERLLPSTFLNRLETHASKV